VNVTGTATAAALPPTVASVTAEELTISAKRTVTLGMGGGGGGMGGGSMMAFTIDGKSFDPNRTDITARIGTAEEWAIRNTSVMDHPFHLHVWPFQIVGGPPTAGWKDTVNVPAGTTVTIRIPFTDLTGRTVYHCHILDHEDLGMMGVINVTG
jgi:FtsP/CotA-like multicopper oxidase with cupredoxin domain